MSDEQVKLLSDEQLIKGLNREAMFTVAPERMKLYGDAAARIAQLNERVCAYEVLIDSLRICESDRDYAIEGIEAVAEYDRREQQP